MGTQQEAGTVNLHRQYADAYELVAAAIRDGRLGHGPRSVAAATMTNIAEVEPGSRIRFIKSGGRYRTTVHVERRPEPRSGYWVVWGYRVVKGVTTGDVEPFIVTADAVEVVR